MERQLALPVSVEDFKEIRQDGYYYVDKTSLIEQVLIGKCKVTLFTRPRRFGKTLNMSMLKHFLRLVRIPLYSKVCISHKILSCVISIWESIL